MLHFKDVRSYELQCIKHSMIREDSLQICKLGFWKDKTKY